MDLNEKIDQGIAAAKAGDKKEARRLLKEVVKTDQSQIDAWMWLSYIVDSPHERQVCLENMLTLDPTNEFALKELAKAKNKYKYNVLLESGYQTAEPTTSSKETAADLAEPLTQPKPNEFINEWLCPYCLAPTKPSDTSCPTCRQSLIIKKRIKEEHSAWLWRAIFLQATVAVFTLGGGAGLFTLLVKLNGIPNPTPFLPAYIGLPVAQPEYLTEQVLTLFPIGVFWGLIAFSLYSLILLLILYFRLPYGHFVYLVSGCILFTFGLVGIVFNYNVIATATVSVLLAFLGMGQIFLSRTLWDDFLFQEGRLRLKIDRGAKTSATLFISARKYINVEMWGLAVIHLRQAVFRAPKKQLYYVTLIMACMQVKRYDLAEDTLNSLEAIFPNSLETKQLRQQLTTLMQESEIQQ